MAGFGDFLSNIGQGFAQQSGVSRLMATGGALLSKIRLGTQMVTPNKPAPNFDVNFSGVKDFRVKIIVPTFYREIPSITYSRALTNQSAIIFPFTPTITQDYTASYNTVNPIHSNYALHFYKNSNAGPIQVSGKFSVQNNQEAWLWLQTTHTLRALTKSYFGADEKRGTPPPICRFNAYGQQQYADVPVVIQSFRVEYSDTVDYYATKMTEEEGGADPYFPTGTMVPTLSTISITMLPIYSRQELLELAHVEDYVKGTPNSRQLGYL